MRKQILAVFGIIAIGFLLVCPSIGNALYILDYEVEFSGATPPEGTDPWLTATFENYSGSEGTGVKLTMSTSGLIDKEYVSEWDFNFDPDLDLSVLSVTYISGQTLASGGTDANIGENLYKADGDGYFDIQFDFAPPPGTFEDKFTSGEESIWLFEYTDLGTFDENSFAFLSYSEETGLVSAAHVQGIGVDNEDSGWVTVPDASVMLLLGSCFLGFAVFDRKRKRS